MPLFMRWSWSRKAGISSASIHRDAIEKVASSKHQRGQIEESGVVVVQAADMKSPARQARMQADIEGYGGC